MLQLVSGKSILSPYVPYFVSVFLFIFVRNTLTNLTVDTALDKETTHVKVEIIEQNECM